MPALSHARHVDLDSALISCRHTWPMMATWATTWRSIASALGYIDAKSFPVLIQATGGGGGFNMGGATTRALTATVVPLVAALLVQRFIVRALSLGAVKG